MKIVLLETSQVGADIRLDRLSELGEVVAYETTNTPEEAAHRIEDADVVVINRLPMNEASLYRAKNLKLITMTSTGINSIDFEYVRKHKIAVANIRGYSTDSVAQHTFALLLYLYEKMPYFDRYVKSGRYIGDHENSSFSALFHELSGKTWGIVGLGQIGVKVAQIAQAFGCEVICHSPSGRTYPHKYRQVDFGTLLQTSDIISIHTPLSSLTEHLFCYEQFQKMKRSAYLINVARGAVVNERDLAKALSENLIAGAGLDVLAQEPMTSDSPFCEFQDSGRLIITPHIAWASVESRTRAIEEVYLNIKAFQNGQERNICR